MKKLLLFLWVINIYAQEISDIPTPLNQEFSPSNEQIESITTQTKKGNFIIGIFGGFNTLSIKDNQLNSKNSIGLSYGAKMGYDFIIKPTHYLRLYVDYSGNNFFDHASSRALMQIILLNLDYKYTFTDLFYFFVGINANNAFLNTKNYHDYINFGGGVNIGFILNLLTYLEFETRLRFITNSFKEKTSLNFEDFINLSVGVNFKF